MKRLENFLDTASTWKVFIFGWVFSGVLAFLLFQFLPDGTELERDAFINFKIGATMGIILGLVFALLNSMAKKSQKFWDYSKEVKSLIDKAETKEELSSIYKNEFNTLRNLSMGNPHSMELTRLFAILQTKHKYGK